MEVPSELDKDVEKMVDQNIGNVLKVNTKDKKESEIIQKWIEN